MGRAYRVLRSVGQAVAACAGVAVGITVFVMLALFAVSMLGQMGIR